MSLFHRYSSSPVGRLKLVASDAALVAVLWQDDDPRRVPLSGTVEEQGEHAVLSEAERQLAEYFAGTRQQFSLPLDLRGTAFQRSVWRALLTIPFGSTLSYGALARQLGSPAASRAVGAANGRNPISIIVPCHRVVGSSGKLTGFAGGLHAKQHLLSMEAPTLFADANCTDASRRFWKGTASAMPNLHGEKRALASPSTLKADLGS